MTAYERAYEVYLSNPDTQVGKAMGDVLLSLSGRDGFTMPGMRIFDSANRKIVGDVLQRFLIHDTSDDLWEITDEIIKSQATAYQRAYEEYLKGPDSHSGEAMRDILLSLSGRDGFSMPNIRVFDSANTKLVKDVLQRYLSREGSEELWKITTKIIEQNDHLKAFVKSSRALKTFFEETSPILGDDQVDSGNLARLIMDTLETLRDDIDSLRPGLHNPAP